MTILIRYNLHVNFKIFEQIREWYPVNRLCKLNVKSCTCNTMLEG